MRLPLAVTLLCAMLAGPAHAQAWEIRKGEAACETQLTLAGRRAPPQPAMLRYDGEQMVLVFAQPAGATFRRLQVDRKVFTPSLRPGPDGLEAVVDPAMETALARGRRLRIVWTKAATATAALGAAGAGLAALKDCAEPFRVARLPQLSATEADAVGVYEGEKDFARQAAIAEARRLYEQERLAALAAGVFVPPEKAYSFEGQAPVVCTSTMNDFACR